MANLTQKQQPEIFLKEYFPIDRCPHCSIYNPNLQTHYEFETTDAEKHNRKKWKIYVCNKCGGVITAWKNAHNSNNKAEGFFPDKTSLDDSIPNKAKTYLKQAIECIHAPSGAVMLCASAVDEMLKELGYTEGKLYPRINKAKTDGILTPEMAKWAHQVRLEANEQRHADKDVELPAPEDAQQSVKFTRTLAELLFVLPSKVTRGIQESKEATSAKTSGSQS